jgi:hypothetical protein
MKLSPIACAVAATTALASAAPAGFLPYPTPGP